MEGNQEKKKTRAAARPYLKFPHETIVAVAGNIFTADKHHIYIIYIYIATSRISGDTAVVPRSSPVVYLAARLL